jgi:ferredoxin
VAGLLDIGDLATFLSLTPWQRLSMRCRVNLVPLAVSLEVERGAPLGAALAPYGVEFPCGGAGTCRGCRVRVLEGSLAVTPEMAAALTAAELASGWRLACRGRVESDITLEVAQWDAPVLGDDLALEFEPGEGCGIAIDLGTTTLAAQLLDL